MISDMLACQIPRNGIMMEVAMVGEIMNFNSTQNNDWKMQELKKDILQFKQEKNPGKEKITHRQDWSQKEKVIGNMARSK